MKDSYDLTKESDRSAAKAAIARIATMAPGGGIFTYLTMIAAERLLPKDPVKEQSEAAIDLIKAGKESGVKKMKVTMEDQAGVDFTCPIDGAKITFSVGKKGKTTLEVEYS